MRDVLSNECTNHRTLLSMILRDASDPSDEENFLNGTSYFTLLAMALRDTEFDLRVFDDSPFLNEILHIRLHTESLTFGFKTEPYGTWSFGYYFDGFLVFSNRNLDTVYKGRGRIVDPEWIDLRLLRDWKTTCNMKHPGRCHLFHAHDVFSHRPKILIDTWRMCLTESSSTEPYVALSYVWGQVPTLKTVQANFKDLLQPLSLCREDFFSMIPRTIRDAMRLTEALHERYIWIDALCIIQDGTTISSDLQKMASIYANAAFFDYYRGRWM